MIVTIPDPDTTTFQETENSKLMVLLRLILAISAAISFLVN